MRARLPPPALAASGWTFHGAGIAAVHHLGRGRYLCLLPDGWTHHAVTIRPDRIFLTAALAQAAFVRAHDGARP